MFTDGLVSGTLAFWRRYWFDGARFPDSSLAEDAAFQRELVRWGARIEKLSNQGNFIYIRHDSNSWRFTPGTFLDHGGWRLCQDPTFVPADDLAFYGSVRGNE